MTNHRWILPMHFTPTQVAAHLACSHVTQLERQRRKGLLNIAFAPDPRLEALRERGRQHEEAYIDQARPLEEVDAVFHIARSLLQSGILWTSVDGEARPLCPSDILVVAPYNAQVGALKRALTPELVTRVGTVDKCQGQEAPVVIYSCTSSSSQDAPRGMAFLYDPHRFNVATSRAQNTVIVVASPSIFEPDCPTPEQMKWANGLCRFADMAKKVSL